MKRTPLVVVVIALAAAAILFGVVVFGQEEVQVPLFRFREEKSILISFKVENNEFIVTDMRVELAPEPGHWQEYGDLGLTVRLLNRDEGTLETFQVWDARFGLEEDSKDKTIEGRIVPRPEATFDLVVPFHRELAAIELIEPERPEEPIASIEVSEVVARFCKQYPDDPLCR